MRPIAATLTMLTLYAIKYCIVCVVCESLFLGCAQDTEFPGVVARPIGEFASSTEFHYQTLRCNVDLMRIIQLGLTFVDEKGEIADDCPTFQFNFSFDRECVALGTH